MKILFGLALRQTTGFVESLLRLLGLDWRVPDFSTLSRRQRTLAVQVPLRGKQECLHLLVDSTGIKMMGEGEWKVKKHGSEYRRQWRKLHLGVDAQSGEICALEVTDNRTNDASVAPTLLSQIPKERTISSVTGDGAYDTRIVMRLLPSVKPMLLFQRDEMPAFGNRTNQVMKLAMKHCRQ